MSLDDVTIVRAAHPATGTELTGWFARDAAAWAGTGEVASPYAADIEFSVPSIGGPGARDSGKGLPALFEVWREWLEPWDRYWTEIAELVDAGDGRVVVLLRDHGRLRGGGAEVVQNAASVWTVDGKIARIDFYLAWAEALEAAQLADQASHLLCAKAEGGPSRPSCRQHTGHGARRPDRLSLHRVHRYPCGLGRSIVRPKQCPAFRVVAFTSTLRVSQCTYSRRERHGNRNSEVVQRRKGLRFHHAR